MLKHYLCTCYTNLMFIVDIMSSVTHPKVASEDSSQINWSSMKSSVRQFQGCVFFFGLKNWTIYDSHKKNNTFQPISTDCLARPPTHRGWPCLERRTSIRRPWSRWRRRDKWWKWKGDWKLKDVTFLIRFLVSLKHTQDVFVWWKLWGIFVFLFCHCSSCWG